MITVCKNAETYIRECIESVISQDYPNVEYIIIDGKSTDRTLAIIDEYKTKIHIVKSESDNSHIEAVQKGLRLATGDIMCWLNSDDKFHPHALSTVAKIFSDLPQVRWLTGFPTWYTPNGACVNELFIQTESTLNGYANDAFYHYFNRWSLERFLSGDYLAIQQESVFWRKEIWQKTGEKVDCRLIAFDMELWSRFFCFEKLYTAPVVLSGFRVHGNQMSADHARYVAECENVIEELRQKMPVLKRIFAMLKNNFATLFKPFYYLDIPVLKNIYLKLMSLPPLIHYDEEKDIFYLG